MGSRYLRIRSDQLEIQHERNFIEFLLLHWNPLDDAFRCKALNINAWYFDNIFESLLLGEKFLDLRIPALNN